MISDFVYFALQKNGSSNQTVLPSCINTILNLAHDNVIRDKLTQRKELWSVLIDLIVSNNVIRDKLTQRKELWSVLIDLIVSNDVIRDN